MSIRVPSAGTVEERLARLEQARNYSEVIHCHGTIDELSGATTTSATMAIMGGWTIPWSELRELMPDDRWALMAAGWLNTPSTGCSLQLTYQKDDQSQVVLGQLNFATGFIWSKIRIGPFAARGDLAPTVPQNENTVTFNIQAAVATAGQQLWLRRWTMWLRMSPRAT